MIKFQFISRISIVALSSDKKIDYLLNLIKDHKILLIEGKLTNKEEAELIRRTMVELYEDFENFKGIEIGVLNASSPELKGINKFKNVILKKLIGETSSITIIGPAKIVRELRQSPETIELYLNK